MENQSLLLVAEDDPDDQYILQDILVTTCPEANETHFVENGIELIDYLKGNGQKAIRPNLVILDLNMPMMDGRTALCEIKADPELAQIPIVVMTTSQAEKDKKYCQDLGTDGFYSKPGSAGELEEIIRMLCQKYFQSQ